MTTDKTNAVMQTANRLHETMHKAQQDMEQRHYTGQADKIYIVLNGRYELINIELSEGFTSHPIEHATTQIKQAFDMAMDEIRSAAQAHLTQISHEFSNQLSNSTHTTLPEDSASSE